METRKAICYNCFQEKPDADGLCPHCGFDLAENEKKFPVALRAGTVLNDRYIIGRVLGQGGFGITYLALDTQLNAKVAIKEFMPGEIATRVGGTTVSVMMDTKSEEFAYGAERFQEEARTLAKFIGNPNIAAVTSYFDENDTSYFVMDYIEGISFKTYIANHGGKISVEETLNVMIPVLRALTAVHAEGFIHRDVTPDNIYITKDGIVKLLDFGSARYSIGDKSKSLDVILKVGYAPKEQYIRRSRQGPFTDVYSCAACFYAAISGFLPPESLERMDEDTLVPISQCGIEIPEYLDKAILKGLAVQPEDRFQNAAEFLDAIESQQVVEVPGTVPATPTVGGQVDALLENVKQRPKFYAAIAAA
ncbi:serine/threonine protein kinase, partial [Oscillibacter sp.]|uniref:serine/threonine protein kinase n=1 Tax=Oscillibacter sp. TaxID=1945593 RepID=UPI002D7F1253